MEDKKYKIADFVDKEIPPEVIKQLQTIGRIQHILKPTTTSAISTSEIQEQVIGDRLLTEKDVQDNIDRLINEVVDFENKVEQLEDLLDEHLKDMSIPPSDNRISDAAKKLGSSDGNITKEVFDKALAMMDLFPLLTTGQDPVLTALIGDGSVDGPWLNCNEITSSIAKNLKILEKGTFVSEQTIKDQSSKIAEQHEKRLANMALEFILILWWNQLWPRVVVDMTIIGPIKNALATPVDSLFGFFQKKPRFKMKNKEWCQKNGPIHKILTKLRIFLLCKIPPIFYKRYIPSVEIIDEKGIKVDCSSINSKCNPEQERNQFTPDNKNPIDQLGKIMDEISGTDGEGNQTSEGLPCFTDNDLIGLTSKEQPTGLGCSPDCINASKIVLDAVLSDALSAPQKSISQITRI